MNRYMKLQNWLALAIAIIGANQLSAATLIWSGTDLVNNNTNWSDAANWVGGTTPIASSDVKFFDLNAVGVVSNLDNIVDASLTIGSLQYGNTNNFHTTLITNGVTLLVTNTGGLFVGTAGGAGAPTTQQVYATVTGTGGALNVSNKAAFITVNQGDVSGSGTQRSILDLTGLGSFNATVANVFVGSTGAGTSPTGNGAAVTGTLLLGATNNLTVLGSPANVHSTSCGIDVAYNGAGTQGGVDYLYLGQKSSINVDTLRVGSDKGVGAMAFGPNFVGSSPSAIFRGTNGGSTRVTYWTVGDQGPRGSGSANALGTNDFTAGTLDAMVGTMVIGQDVFAGGSSTFFAGGTSGNVGVFAYNAGTLDVNTLTLGNIQNVMNTTNKEPSIGIMGINGAATLRVNTVLQMGSTVNNNTGGATAGTYGQLGITNATALINSITVASNTVSPKNSIILSGATFIVSNALAASFFPLTNFTTANSTIGLTVTADASAKVFVGNLVANGTTNQIQLNAAPVFFTSYPTQFALVKFASLNADNFGLVNIPGWAIGANLLSNGPNASLDLSLPSDPRPIITSEPTSYSGSPGDNVTTNFAVTISAGSVTPLSYQWYFVTNSVTTLLTDGTGPSGTSTLTGSATSNLQIVNAQPGDNGSYYVVITNLYGSVTSAPLAVLTISAGAIAPSITGPANQTVIQSNNATFTASVSGSPLPVIQWQRNGTDISGATSTTLVVPNVQYPADNNAVFSIIATNTAGKTTNFATLTVIVPPAITLQPTSLTVTNTQSASFTVTASGVPGPTFQWFKNNSPITLSSNSTATSATLSIAATSPSDIASYYVVAQNAAGSATSSVVSLTVNSTMGVTVTSPANGATGICYDATLAVTFNAAPVLRNAGTIKIYDTTNSTTPVDTIDLSQNVNNGNSGAGPLNTAINIQPRNIGGIPFSNFPVIITGNTAAIYPHLDLLTSNQTYYVTIDDGCFTDTNGAYFAGINAGVWQFTTKAGGPVNPTNLVVDVTGNGDFDTVQGAVDFIPANNTNYTLINILNGTYTEIVCIQSKNNITFRGQNRFASRIAYSNNNNMNGGFNGQQTCSTFRCNANDISIENLTITNTTPQGGSQAFALQVGNNSLRFISLNAEIDSYQDTILVANPPTGAYFRDSLIQGDVDYIWGSGTLFFTNCQMNTLRTSGGYMTNPRAAAGTNGISFVHCSVTVPSSAYTNSVFARAIGVANGNTVLINCRIDTHAYNGFNPTDVTNLSLNLRWWEYGNSNLDCTLPVTFNGTELTNGSPDPRVLLAENAVAWLNGWQPQLAPNILTNPANQLGVPYGTNVTFAVVATGIPDPTYQWQYNGSPIPGATAATLTLNGVTPATNGTYSVIVTTPAGSATSSGATLSVANATPVFIAPPAGTNITINVGVNLAISCTATDSDTLTYSLLTGPVGSAVDSASGNFTWRPTTAQANTVNPVNVVVTDNGTPNLSATNNFTVTVNPLASPTTASPIYSGGQFSVSVGGQVGPDYYLQANTNLMGGSWTTVASTNSPASVPVILTDPNAGSQPIQFYRIVTGPPAP